MSDEKRAAELLDTAGRTFADEAGVALEDKPAALYRLLVLAVLLSSGVQAKLRPHLDARALDGAAQVGLPTDAEKLATLVEGDDLARFCAALVRANLDDSVADEVSG